MADFDYVRYALRHYTSPLFNEDEFMRDLNKIIVLKKMFRRFDTSDNINARLVLNNIIILTNMFGVKCANVLLFYRVEPEHWSLLKTFLVFLNSYIETNENRNTQLDEDVTTILGAIRWHSHSV